MSKSPWILLVAFGLLMVPTQRAEAQVDVGVQVPYNTEVTDGAFGLGARLGVGVPVAGLGVQGDFNWYFPDSAPGESQDFWEILASATYSLPSAGVSPYFGAGLSYQKLSAEAAGIEADFDETGFNLLGGVRLGSVLPVNAYGELSYRVMDDFENQFIVSVGVLF